MSYDSHCYDLAQLFLSGTQIDTDAKRHQLAQHIQTAVEDWISYEEGEQTRRVLNDETCSSHPCPPLEYGRK